jgi:hypothetical protein
VNREVRSARVRARVTGPLPDGFERWIVSLSPGQVRVSSAAEWSGALIVVDAGTVEVGCFAGATTTFATGDVLALSCLPLRWLRNPGLDDARIVAVRRSTIASGG